MHSDHSNLSRGQGGIQSVGECERTAGMCAEHYPQHVEDGRGLGLRLRPKVGWLLRLVSATQPRSVRIFQHSKSRPQPTVAGFTVTELMVSISILAVIVIAL